MVEAEPDDREAALNAWIDQQMRAASRLPVRLMRDTIITGISAGLATYLCGVLIRGLGWLLNLTIFGWHGLITTAEICHARHPNQCLLAWAIGSFLVSQIIVEAVVAPLLAHFGPVVWRGIGVS